MNNAVNPPERTKRKYVLSDVFLGINPSDEYITDKKTPTKIGKDTNKVEREINEFSFSSNVKLPYACIKVINGGSVIRGHAPRVKCTMTSFIYLSFKKLDLINYYSNVLK